MQIRVLCLSFLEPTSGFARKFENDLQKQVLAHNLSIYGRIPKIQTVYVDLFFLSAYTYSRQ